MPPSVRIGEDNHEHADLVPAVRALAPLEPLQNNPQILRLFPARGGLDRGERLLGKPVEVGHGKLDGARADTDFQGVDPPLIDGETFPDSLRAVGALHGNGQSVDQHGPLYPAAGCGRGRAPPVQNQHELEVVDLPRQALPASPVLHVLIAEQLDPAPGAHQIQQLFEGDDPFGVVAQHDVPGVDRLQQMLECLCGAAPVAVGRTGPDPVPADRRLAAQPSVPPQSIVDLRPVPERDGVQQMVVGSVLVLVVRGIEVAQICGPGAYEVERVLAADPAVRGSVDQDRHLQTNGAQDPPQGVPSVSPETLVTGLEHPGGVGMGGALVQQGGQEQELLLECPFLLAPLRERGGLRIDPAGVQLLYPAAHRVDDQGILPRVEQPLRAVVGLLRAGRGVVPGDVGIRSRGKRVELGQHRLRASVSPEQRPALGFSHAEMGVVQHVGVALPVVGQHAAAHVAGQP